MKCFLIFFALVLAAVSTVSAAEPCAMKFSTTEHDFGRIAERGKPVSFVFEFTNEGTTPLIITQASVSCKCTSIDIPRKPVPPGGKGRVTVSYNPRKQNGQIYKIIQLVTNCKQERMLLIIKGEVS